MIFIRGIQGLAGHARNTEQGKGCVATIGNFDGVHIGHQHVLRQLVEQAQRMSLPSVVIIFEPQPLEYFSASNAPGRLTRLREKIRVLNDSGIDKVLCIHFSKRFAALTYQEFIHTVLIDGLAVRYLVVGDDFCFGKNRAGNFSNLQQAGEEHNFTVTSMDTFLFKDERVSSTRVRQALEKADFHLVKCLLNRDYSMSGHVAHGEKLGRELGFPTANIHIRRKRSPLSGIYIVEVDGVDAKPLPAVASIGTRPTINGKQVILEVYIFNFDREIYGQLVNVRFLKKIREELKFDSLDTLTEKIKEDVRIAKSYFKL